MKAIYKYKLKPTDFQTIAISGLVKVLSVAEQRDNIVIYALVDTEKTKISDVDIVVIGTGRNASLRKDFKFLGTVNTYSGEYMWHIFYRLHKKGLK